MTTGDLSALSLIAILLSHILQYILSWAVLNSRSTVQNIMHVFIK